MKRTTRSFLLLGAVWLATAIAMIPSPLDAENLGPGGGTRIIVGDEIVGPYRLLVTSAPEPAQVGIVTFVVRISDPGTDAKVQNADVVVELVHGEDGTVLTRSATHNDAGNPVDYAAHIQIDKPGTYSGRLRITGPAGVAEVPFIQRVTARRQFGTLLLIGIPFAAVLGILASIWFGRSRSRQPA